MNNIYLHPRTKWLKYSLKQYSLIPTRPTTHIKKFPFKNN